jgi:hypothetical protein
MNRTKDRKVLMIAPHFPPDTGAAAHRVRLLAPYLRDYGWEPTVLTVDRNRSGSRQDADLEALVPRDLRVVRAPAWSETWTRKLGIGDLGLRSFAGLFREASRLLRDEDYDALYITIFPTYPALLGPILKWHFGVPFVLDYQDPWVGAWGDTVGGAKSGAPDVKSRLTRLAGLKLEPLAARAADAITAVSSGTYESIEQRIPEVKRKPRVAIPLGGDASDFSYLRSAPRPFRYFDPRDGGCHLCYVGTLLPLGFETLRAVLEAVALLRDSRADVYGRLRLHFFGTSNQTLGDAPLRVIPLARQLGVENAVTEHPLRVDYLDALTVQLQASAILLMGSSESHYTASKLYPALLAGRPLLAVYHRKSSVADIMTQVTRAPYAQLITYSEDDPPDSHTTEIADALITITSTPSPEQIEWSSAELETFSARSLAGKLARVLDVVSARVDDGRHHRP